MENRSNNENASDKVTWIQFLRQVNVSLTIWCYFFIVGLVTGAPTVIIPQLIKETNTTVVLEDKFYPWITSIGSYTSIPCNLILTLLSHFCGRKKTLLAISICTFSASVLLYYSRSPAHIFFSQMIYGVTGAGQMTVYGPILAEYSSTKYRGIFLTLKSATFFWGIWTANAIGIFTHYKFIGLLAVLCSSYCFSTGFFIPESPYWLAFKGKYDQCAETHRLLKGEDEKAEKELKDLINLQEELHVHDVKFRPIKQCILHYVEIIQLPDVYKPILLCLLVFLVYHISGKLVCAVYALEIMKEITDKESTAHIGVLVLDGFSVLGMYIGCGRAGPMFLFRLTRRRTRLDNKAQHRINRTLLRNMRTRIYSD
ncbi:uncharacterized protein LOC114364816 [Ostrinia furnacalis]|uniref:uncharacterized protein LOC114364816 n=1 Tax=Ostrinia furnacalis TaxID=93504 RepID=UPI0010400D8B|nr:uncharacterized protein LOC114364816 [Ostrinia furnacalis]